MTQGSIISAQMQSLNPRDVGALAVWLDATVFNSITKNGSNLVSSWRDRSGNNNNAAQGTDARKPLYVASGINGRPSLYGRHDSSNASQLDITDATSLNYQTTPGTASTARFTIFTVFQRVADMGAIETLSSKYVTTGDQREFWQILSASDLAGTTVSASGTSSVSTPLVTGAISTGTPELLISDYNGTNATVEKTTGATASSAVAGIFNGTGKMTLFSRPDFNDPLQGYIGEHLFFTEFLASTPRAAVTNYLKKKWGMA